MFFMNHCYFIANVKKKEIKAGTVTRGCIFLSEDSDAYKYVPR